MASNTSTLPVTGLAELWPHPEEFIGLHFFSPVERMAVVEVIQGRQTSPHALARALDLVAQLRKLPIVVNDSPGFYTSRIFCAYIDEGMAMLAEGVAPALIENAARQAGFATSPLAVTDEVSLDLQQRVIRQAASDGLPARFLRQHARPVVEAMVERGRLGRKSGGGFHDFPPGQAKRLWPGLKELFTPAPAQPPLIDVKHRLLYVEALESARCVEEGVVPEAADGDLGSVLALGYPRWTGGTFSFIDTVGPARFVAECDRLADGYVERFRPSAWLRERATSRLAFYPVP
jgi:3-hydroxyacyl-CoA dehydrogenase/enoyl-CoA hydratase/3-hydroxybutyryl-CoA epimerase